jgi:HTH-type transcriptional regulator/antitoxin HipB
MKNTIYTPEQLGKVLKGQRKLQKLTQSELGNSVGLLQKTVSLLETNPKGSTIESLFKVLSSLGLALELIPKSELITKTDSDNW